MNLPPEFISNIEGGFGEAGRQFLADLPASINEASAHWGLTDIQPSPTLSYNFVAFAKRAHLHLRQVQVSTSSPLRSVSAHDSPDALREHDVVLKMGVPIESSKVKWQRCACSMGRAHAV